MRPGHYKVVATALLRTGQGMQQEYLIASDTVPDLFVDSLYQVPATGIPYHIFSLTEPYGIVPSFDCAPTGMAQIHINHGHFPYTVEVWRISSDTALLRTLRFDTLQHSGNNPLSADYRNYYDIDSLEAGNYLLHFYDGCGYHTPDMTVSVPSVVVDNEVFSHLLRNSSGDKYSDNVITIKESYTTHSNTISNDDYYRYMSFREPVFQYRFINPTRCEAKDTTQWYDMPVMAANASVFIHDTISTLDNYGEIWFRPCKMEIRTRYCEEIIDTFAFTIYPQGTNVHSIGTRVEYIYQHNAYYDCAGFHNLGFAYDRFAASCAVSHNWDHLSNYSGDSVNVRHPYGYTSPGFITNNSIGMRHHSYITLPVTLKITNISKDTVILIQENTRNEFYWSVITIIDSIYSGDSLVLEVFDKNMCPVASFLYPYKYNFGTVTQAPVENLFTWDSLPNKESLLCSGVERTIGIYQKNGYTYSIADSTLHYFFTYAGDTIRLVESPDGNRYNFDAILEGYNSVRFTQVDTSLSLSYRIGRHTVGVRTYPTFEVTGLDLPRGQYRWVISFSCTDRRDTIVTEIRTPGEPIVEEDARYTFSPGCSQLNIVPVAGQMAIEDVALETYFNIHPSGVVEHNANSVRLGDTLSIGIPGSYILSMYALPSNNGTLLSDNPCYIRDTVIFWDGETITLDYQYGYVCQADDTIGVVRARGKNGVLPYRYTLYSGPSGSGDSLASNLTGEFFDMPIRLGQTISVRMQDSCGAYFTSNLTVSNLNIIRKGWIENGQTDVTFTIGDTCHLYSLSLGDVNYRWSGPMGFTSEEPELLLVLDDLEMAGRYHISIEGSGCGLLCDSMSVIIMEAPCPMATDYDGHVYEAVRIGGLCWMSENLRSTHYSDGRDILHVYMYHSYMYPDSVANSERFGNLYNWYDAMDWETDVPAEMPERRQGICPAGWRMPTREEFEALDLWGDALRSPLYWWDGGGDNSTGFSALPAGYFLQSKNRYENLYYETRFWSSVYDIESQNSSILAFIAHCNQGIFAEQSRLDAYSIRCVYDD